MKKTETLNLRVSKEFKRRLQEEAKKEHRSVTNYLEIALTGLWERRGSIAEDAELSKKKTRS
jgi:predicted HicB family RNase H-like nuclease